MEEVKKLDPETKDFKETPIIEDIRGAAGLDTKDDSFDIELLMHINALILSLVQIGVGKPIYVTAETKWEDYMDNDAEGEVNDFFPLAMTYIFIRTKLVFDPPSATTKESMEKSAKEFFWRLGVGYNAVGGGT